MKVDDIKSICVVGAGNMGNQISLLGAICGYKVNCLDVSEKQLNKAKGFVEKYLLSRVEKGRLTESQAKDAKNNLSFTSDFRAAVSGIDFVIEAATEKLELKRDLFAQIDKIAPAHAILSTNSSFIVSSMIADVTGRPEKVCNMHFFNPALVMKCVEVVRGPHTSDDTAKVTMELSKKLNKIPVLLNKEVYGFLVNRIVNVIHQEALYLFDTGVATLEDIDSAVVNALGHPMGPFRLLDLTGIDLAYDIAMERYAETGLPEDKPSPTIVGKFIKGEWGEKVGKGFYEYKK